MRVLHSVSGIFSKRIGLLYVVNNALLIGLRALSWFVTSIHMQQYCSPAISTNLTLDRGRTPTMKLAYTVDRDTGKRRSSSNFYAKLKESCTVEQR